MSVKWIEDGIDELERHGFVQERRTGRGWLKYVHEGPPRDVVYLPDPNSTSDTYGASFLQRNKQSEIAKVVAKHPLLNPPRIVKDDDDGLAAAEALLRKKLAEEQRFDPVADHKVSAFDEDVAHDVKPAPDPEPVAANADAPMEGDDVRRQHTRRGTRRVRNLQPGGPCPKCTQTFDSRMGLSQHLSGTHGIRGNARKALYEDMKHGKRNNHGAEKVVLPSVAPVLSASLSERLLALAAEVADMEKAAAEYAKAEKVLGHPAIVAVRTALNLG